MYQHLLWSLWVRNYRSIDRLVVARARIPGRSSCGHKIQMRNKVNKMETFVTGKRVIQSILSSNPKVRLSVLISAWVWSICVEKSGGNFIGFELHVKVCLRCITFFGNMRSCFVSGARGQPLLLATRKQDAIYSCSPSMALAGHTSTISKCSVSRCAPSSQLHSADLHCCYCCSVHNSNFFGRRLFTNSTTRQSMSTDGLRLIASLRSSDYSHRRVRRFR